MMKQRNIPHIKGVCEAAFAAIDDFTRAKGIEEVNALDAVVGLTLAIAKIIKSAPDSETKSRLQYAVMQAVTGDHVGVRSSGIIMPAGHA